MTNGIENFLKIQEYDTAQKPLSKTTFKYILADQNSTDIQIEKGKIITLQSKNHTIACGDLLKHFTYSR